MFTGIIKEKGTVKKIFRSGREYKIEITADSVGNGLDLGASIAVNGVCLSLVEKKKRSLVFDIVKNTYDLTNLKRVKKSSPVNLEEALKAGDDISGHMVSGHVDAERKILKNQRSSSGWILDIETSSSDNDHIAPKGSIAIDGISLTISEIKPGYLRIFLIPHTLENTTLSNKKPGDFVNIEFDMLSKYSKPDRSAISRDFLAKRGFI